MKSDILYPVREIRVLRIFKEVDKRSITKNNIQEGWFLYEDL